MNPVLLHCPQFLGNEKKYLNECIDTKFVSYVSHFVTDMEEQIKKLTGAKCAVAMVSGTEALHMAMVAAGVKAGEEVISQPYFQNIFLQQPKNPQNGVITIKKLVGIFVCLV